jgi:hypothetical protein
MFVQVAAACALIIVSHWMPPEAQELALRTGWSVVVLAIARWLAKQGKRQPVDVEKVEKVD